MKKQILIFFLLLFNTIIIGQTKKDTIYLYFNHKKDMSLKVSTYKNKEPFSYLYTYYLNDSLNKNLLININVDDMIDFDNKADIKWVDKKFIRKNDNKIYYIKKMKNRGYQNIINELYDCVIYLIDTKIKEKGKYKAREVKINFKEDM